MASEQILEIIDNIILPKKVPIVWYDTNIEVDPRDRGVAGPLISNKKYEPYEIEIIGNYLKSGMVGLDVGANIGLYSIVMSNLVGKTGHIYAIEPDNFNYGLLKSNLKLFNNINLLNIALSDYDGKISIYKDKTNFGGHSISKINTNGNEFFEIETKTIDYLRYEIIKGRIGFIKIDVEGAEGKVIRGALQTLKGDKPVLFIEFNQPRLRNCGENSNELLILFENLDYDIFIIDEHKRSINTITKDSNGRMVLGEFSNLILCPKLF